MKEAMTGCELFHFFFWFIDSVHSKDGTAFCAGGGFSWLIGNLRSPEPPNGNQNWHLKMLWFPGTRFSEVPKSCFMFAVFAFNIKVSIILKMIEWKYQLKKQNWPVCELGTVLYYSTSFDFKIYLRTRNVTGPIEKQAPGSTAINFKAP